MDRALPIFSSSVCRCNWLETQELPKRKYMALRSNILLVPCLCNGQSHSPELNLKSRIYSTRTFDCCDTAPSSWGWVLVANTTLCVGVFCYLETQWLHPADRNLAAAPSSSTEMTQMRSIYPIYTASWLRNAVPECLGVFGLSLVPLSIFMNVPAPGFILQCKNQKGTPTCKLLDLMGTREKPETDAKPWQTIGGN